jgi:NAD(P)-dependent dehydrogenase (short-subunit alcohol dehydrogenase family)
MEIRFDAKTAVVTGGAGGIGYACAERLVESGAKVVLVGANADKLDNAVNNLNDKGTVAGCRIDLSQVEDIPGAVSRIRQDFGEIEILVQTAGLLEATRAQEITRDRWDAVLNVNSRGLFFMMQAVCSQSMIPKGSGAIVNIASVAGIRGMKAPLCSAHYSASKGAVVQLTRQAAVEWAHHNIRVNAVAPGGVKTGHLLDAPPEIMAAATQPIPLGKLSEPGDVANAVCFLASSAASMITGQILVVDGGGTVVGA